MAALNPFEIFSLPKKFALNEEELTARYIEVVKKVHPDRFANAGEAEKRVAQQWATLINESYAKLKSPTERAKLLCESLGVKVNENSSGGIEEEFLLEQLERRERLEEALEAQDQAELDALAEEINREYGLLVAELEKKLDEDKDAAAAALFVQKLLFLNRQKSELAHG